MSRNKKLIRYPEGIGECNFDTFIHFTLYNRPDSQTATEDTQILLYMPESLENPMSTSWEHGTNVDQWTKDNLGVGGSWSANIDRIQQSFNQKLTQVTDTSGYTSLQGEEKIANPYMAMTFKGIDFRSYSLTFKFTPHSEEESTTIQDIIKEFRKAALPSGCANTGVGASGDGYIGFPNEIDIEYEGLGAKWLNKFKKCVIEDLNVNYTGVGFFAGMTNGFPAETILTMKLTENLLVCREDIDKGF
jgi:hypothetical protein